MENTVNDDNSDLQPIRIDPFVVGFVDEVNGPASREVPEYSPTRAELLELAKYWEFIFLDTEYFVCATGQVGSSEMRLARYAERRVARVVDLLGDKAIQAVCEIRYGFAKGIGSRNWAEFREYLGSGGPYWEEREEFLARLQEADPYRHPNLTRLKLILLALRMMVLALLPRARWIDGGSRPWDAYEYMPWWNRVAGAFRCQPPYDPQKRADFYPPF